MEQKKGMWNGQPIAKMNIVHLNNAIEYGERYGIDVWELKDELWSRLDKEKQEREVIWE